MTGLTRDLHEKIRAVFSRYPQIDEVILYGSRAKGTHRPGSDIDISLKGECLDLKILNKIGNDLDDLLLPYFFDLSIFSQIENQELMLSQKHQDGWLSKKRQMQGAQLSSNEAYLRTSKQRDDCSNAAVGEFLRRHQELLKHIERVGKVIYRAGE